MENPRSLDPSVAHRVSVRLDEAVPVLAQVVGHMQRTNAQLLQLSTELLDLQRTARASVARQSALVALLCVSVLGSLFLAWQISTVSTRLDRAMGELAEARTAAATSQKGLEAAAKTLQEIEKKLVDQTRAVQGVVDAAPRVTLDDNGRLKIEVAVDADAARSIARRKSPTAPVSPGKAELPITNGRIDFNGN